MYKLNDKIKAFGKEYIIVGLSQMVYDEDCTGEPEWKITHEIQEIAIATYCDGISYQKPSWHKLSEIVS